MSQFSIGEMAIIIAPGHPFNGEEVEIIGPIGYQENAFVKCSAAYPILFKDGCNGWAAPKKLRKKRPPRTSNDIEETHKYGPGQWDLMPWNPKEKKNVFSHEDN